LNPPPNDDIGGGRSDPNLAKERQRYRRHRLEELSVVWSDVDPGGGDSADT
jgi:hypothetical protein